MRITPTKEQVKYLQSIGLFPEEKISAPKMINKGRKPPPQTGRKPRNFIHRFWWVIVLAILAILTVFLADFVKGQDLSSSPKIIDYLPNGSQPKIFPDESNLANDPGGKPAADNPHPLPPTEKNPMITQLKGKCGISSPPPPSKTEPNRSIVVFKQKPLHHNTSDDHTTKTINRIPKGTGNVPEDNNLKGGENQVNPLASFNLILLLIIMSINLLILVVYVMTVKEKSKREHQLCVCLNELNSLLSVISKDRSLLSDTIRTDQEKQPQEEIKAPPLYHCHDTPGLICDFGEPVPSPETQLTNLINASQKNQYLRKKPGFPSGRWRCGLATHPGMVRGENQDYGLCFQIDNNDVIIIADGCGGVAHGQRAAYLATVSAAWEIIHHFGIIRTGPEPKMDDVSAKAIQAAESMLAQEAKKINLAVDYQSGLRTTLIVVIAGPQTIRYTHIGDGGGCVLRSDGRIEHFLRPQKGHATMLNILAASLGPTTQGKSAAGMLERRPEDLVLVGTDGVFDRIGKSFPKDVLRYAINNEGDLQKTAEQVLNEMAVIRDADNFICDDNLTLALVGTDTAPILSADFWTNHTGNQNSSQSATTSRVMKTTISQGMEDFSC